MDDTIAMIALQGTNVWTPSITEAIQALLQAAKAEPCIPINVLCGMR